MPIRAINFVAAAGLSRGDLEGVGIVTRDAPRSFASHGEANRRPSARVAMRYLLTAVAFQTLDRRKGENRYARQMIRPTNGGCSSDRDHARQGVQEPPPDSAILR